MTTTEYKEFVEGISSSKWAKVLALLPQLEATQPMTDRTAWNFVQALVPLNLWPLMDYKTWWGDGRRYWDKVSQYDYYECCMALNCHARLENHDSTVVRDALTLSNDKTKGYLIKVLRRLKDIR